jgi:hypothetical protein
MRQRAQLVERPYALAGHATGQHEPVGRRVDVRHLVDAVVRIERERPRDVGLGIGRREPLAAEQPRLHAIVDARHLLEKRVHRRIVVQRAAAQHRQAAERQDAPVEQAPGAFRARAARRARATGGRASTAGARRGIRIRT